MRAKHPTILLIGDTLNLGGTEGQFVEVACGLNKSRWDLHVSCLRAEGPLRARLEAAGVQAWSCGRGSFKSPHFAAALWGLIRYLRAHQVQLVHCFDFYSNVLGVMAARLAGVPAIIASQRDLADMRSPMQGQAQRLALRLATVVLVNADAVRRRLVDEKVVPAERVILIRNGVDLDRFYSLPRTHSFGFPFVIGTVANLRPEKGVDDLLRAGVLVVQHVPKVQLVIWGDGVLRRQLESLARELAIADVTRFAGHTASVQDALHGFQLFAFPPRLNEGFSNSLLEAMAVGLPVIATRVGGNAELVEDEKTGLLVPPGDPAALAKAIIRLINEPLFAQELAARGRDRVRAEFGIDRMLARIEALYDRLLAEGDD